MQNKNRNLFFLSCLSISFVACNLKPIFKKVKDPYSIFKHCQKLAEVSPQIFSVALNRPPTLLEHFGYYFNSINVKGRSVLTNLSEARSEYAKTMDHTTFQFLGEGELPIMKQIDPEIKAMLVTHFFVHYQPVPAGAKESVNVKILTTPEIKKNVFEFFIRMYEAKHFNNLLALYLMDEPDNFASKYGLDLTEVNLAIDQTSNYIKGELKSDLRKYVLEKLEKKYVFPSAEEKQIIQDELNFIDTWTPPKTVVVYTVYVANPFSPIPQNVDWVGFDVYSHQDFVVSAGLAIDVRAPSIDDVMCAMTLKMNPQQKMLIIPQAFVGRAYSATEEMAFVSQLEKEQKVSLKISEKDYRRLSNHYTKKIVETILPEESVVQGYGKYEDHLYAFPGLELTNAITRDAILTRRLRRWMCYTSELTQSLKCSETREFKDNAKYTPPNGLGRYIRNKYKLNYPIVAVAPFLWNWPDSSADYTITIGNFVLDSSPLTTVGNSDEKIEKIENFAKELKSWGTFIKNKGLNPSTQKPYFKHNLDEIEGDMLGKKIEDLEEQNLNFR